MHICRTSLLLGLVATLLGCQMPVAQNSEVDATQKEDRCPSTPLIAAASTPYSQNLIKAISGAAFYPESALDHKQSGEIILCVNVARDGQVLRALVQHSSGYALLDGAALYSVGQASSDGEIERLPDPPGGRAKDEWFEVPVRFTDSDPQLEAQPTPPCTPVSSNNWYRAIQRLLQKYMAYPPSAVSDRDEGSALVRWDITAATEFSNVRIFKSAGNPLLDDAALVVIGVIGISHDRPCLPANFGESPDGFTVQVPISWEFSPIRSFGRHDN